MNWLGVDYGERRIGLALLAEQEVSLSPRPLGILVRTSRQAAVERLAELVAREGVSRVVVGIPLAPDGGLGLRGTQARNFARDLARRVEVPVVLQDERDSTREAMERLVAMGVPQRKRAERIDEMAAIIILERYVREGAPMTTRLEGANPC